MPNNRPYVLSIAGFDPSGGAGVLADIKTFEANKVMGLGVCTSITIQNESEFDSLTWVSVEEIKKQIHILTKKYAISFVKIGLIESFDVLVEIIECLKAENSLIKIIWDPILKASAGFDFHRHIETKLLNQILNEIYLITPNLPEAQILFQDIHIKKYLTENHLNTHVLLKGGHSNDDFATDILFSQLQTIEIVSPKLPYTAKHGSGCVLSSAITAHLAKGETLENACRNAKKYIKKYLQSTDTLLGIHRID